MHVKTHMVPPHGAVSDEAPSLRPHDTVTVEQPFVPPVDPLRFELMCRLTVDGEPLFDTTGVSHDGGHNWYFRFIVTRDLPPQVYGIQYAGREVGATEWHMAELNPAAPPFLH